MLLTITTTHVPATDLGYLLHKHPDRVFTFALPLGQGTVFYPEATRERCTAALLVELDPVLLSRGRPGSASGAPLEPYVNDRPYVASSYLSGALREAFGTALSGRSKERQGLAERPLPFAVHLPALPARGGPDLIQRLFGPLGYQVQATLQPLDPAFPEWGNSEICDVTLETQVHLRALLAHLSVLLPVLDDRQHSYVDDAEVDTLLRRGAGWLEQHPERELISWRFLKHRRALQQAARAQLNDGDTPAPTPAPALNGQWLAAVLAALQASGARSVLDLGCGEGNLLALLLGERQFSRLLGMDVSPRALERARRRLQLDDLPEAQRARITLVQGSLTYRDARLDGFDAAALVEVIEHLEPDRLWALERAVFGAARPGTLVVTTPNAEYNARFARLSAGDTRHADHRFEWTRDQFQTWARRVADEFGYTARFQEVGEPDPDLGPPTQLAVFTRGSA